MDDEYISREAALTALQDSDLFNTTERQLRAIRELPAANVAEVVHGRWKKVQKTGSTWECSACGVKVGAFLAGYSQYCYCYGARMNMDGAAE